MKTVNNDRITGLVCGMLLSGAAYMLLIMGLAAFNVNPNDIRPHLFFSFVGLVSVGGYIGFTRIEKIEEWLDKEVK